MGYKDNAVESGFGQLGSVFNNTVSAVTPPTGKVFVAIPFITDTKLNETNGLVADTVAAHGLEYIGTGNAAHNATVGAVDGSGETALTGGGGKAVLSGTVFPKGLTLYGRWTKITTISAGQYVAYIGD